MNTTSTLINAFEQSEPVRPESAPFVPANAAVIVDANVPAAVLPANAPHPWEYSNYYYVAKDDTTITFTVRSRGTGSMSINGQSADIPSGGTVRLSVAFARAGWYLMSCKNLADVCPPRYFSVEPGNLVGLEDTEEGEPLPDEEPCPCCECPTGSTHEELSSVRCHIAFGTFPKWAGMPRGYLYLKAKSINEPALKSASLLYRHVSQRKISFVMDGVIHIAWETGELVAYRDNPLSDILLPDGASQIRTAQLVKLDAAGNPTLGEAAFTMKSWRTALSCAMMRLRASPSTSSPRQECSSRWRK